jgi:hemerythrin
VLAMLMPWNDSYNIGIPTIDRQHLELYNMINNLSAAMKRGKGRLVAAVIMEQLSSLIPNHFAEEEKTLLQLNSPAYDECRSKHASDLNRIVNFLQNRSASDPSAVIDLLYLLDDLLDGHIESDKRAIELSPEIVQ